LIARNFGFVQIVKLAISHGLHEMSDEENARSDLAARAYDRGNFFFSRLRHVSWLGAKISGIRAECWSRD
jgi:hypothetical protein